MSLLRILPSFALAMLLAPGICVAQTATWYRVEIIVFERPSPSAGAGERWPGNPGSPGWENAATLQPAGAGRGKPVPFERLPSKDYQLGPHWWSLSRGRSGTEPLLHRAWVQPVRGERGAVPVYLSLSDTSPGSEFGQRLEGTVRIRRGRFLHADLDLVLRRRDGTYRMQESRRMRSGELHYIDHPILGVLMKITPVRVGGPEEGAPSEEPAG